MLVPGAREEKAVQFGHVFAAEFVGLGGEIDCALESADVGEDALSRDVARLRREGGFREPPMRQDETLDARRGDRLGTQELTGERLEVWGRRRLLVQLAASQIGVCGCSSDFGTDQKALIGDRRGDVCTVGKAATCASAAERLHTWLPAALDERSTVR